ncbi:MAG: enoyl-CoA hydratase-related protein [Candidatus Kapabacteria bacterium]|nr:enoyl-CoA hydratase-related protein [Candidatus Kapabacteria bacterium]
MEYQFISYSLENNIAKITLNRPEVLNSFNFQMAKELQDALDEVNKNDEVRVVIITGTGKAFSAGQDLSEAINLNTELSEIVERNYIPIVTKIRNLEKPVIAAVNGVAAGAGANIALCCDFVIASKEAYFIQAFSKIGLVPDSGGTYILPRLIGLARSTSLMMLGNKLSATDAENLGMIFKSTEEEDFDVFVREFSAKLSEMPTKALALTKKLLNTSFENSFEEQLEAEKNAQCLAGNSQDYREGVNAFLEKRKPIFKGK